MAARKKFGTAPVFFTAISTILGAIMFLRFGWAVGTVGFLGTIGIILLGHAVTVPTAMSIAEIATNQKVEGGGEYFIISRSFGLVIGSSIGIALFFSQAISVAFYIMAFAEAFTAAFNYIVENYDLHPTVEWLLRQRQTVSIPGLFILTAIVLWKGADLGVKALYVVVFTLFVSMVAFFLGTTDYSETHTLNLFENVYNSTESSSNTAATIDSSLLEVDSTSAEVPVIQNQGNEPLSPLTKIGFFAVFAIIFPAFTGMTAGVGLSGDLEKPSRSIPLGTLAGTLVGMVIYVAIAYKLSISASPVDLANTDELVMAKIAWGGWWLIPLGLAAATISSALGSLMVAPRTLQAIARDKVIPSNKINHWLSLGRGKSDEPFNSTLVTIGLAFVFVLAGELDFVAEIISMFFMMSYGSLNLISFFQHFAADPSYRPTFRSKWFISLFGAIACFGLMFFMNAGYAFLAILFMVIFYILISHFNSDKKNIASIFQGVIFQLSRQLHVYMQKAEKETTNWRPAAVAISENSFERMATFDLLRWISQRYGFGTYIHKINGYLSKTTNQEAKEAKERLIRMAETSGSNIYIDTMISPSYTSAIAQVIQLPGISGTDNNLLLLEYYKGQSEANLKNIIDNFKLIRSVDFDVLVLGSSARGFGLKQEIHIWITSNDYENANLMILLGYILIGHKDWKNAHIKIFALYPEDTCNDERERLFELIDKGRLPISKNNITVIPRKANIETKTVVEEYSKDADLTILGFRAEALKHSGAAIFEEYSHIGNTVFVNAAAQKTIE